MKKLFVALLTVVIFLNFSVVAAGAEENAVNVSAQSYVLMDASTGEILLSKNEHEKHYPASVTKIMPILLVMEALDEGKIKLSDVVTASAVAASKGGSQIWLKEGEQMTVDELLRASVIASANDACTALGEFIAGSEEAAVRMMNDKAKELGMNNSHFENCTGLDDEATNHLTTAYDIALMSKELLSYEKITEYSTVWMDSLRNGATQLVNTNRLVRFYKGTTGLKTGTTSKAGYCISASAERNGLHLIAVVMGSKSSNDRFEGAKALLNYGFANFETVTPDFDLASITQVNVIRGIESSFIPVLEKINPVTLKSGDKNKIETEIQLSTDVEAPVEKNQTVGKVTFKVKDKVIGEYRLYCEKVIRKIKITDIMLNLIRSLTLKG